MLEVLLHTEPEHLHLPLRNSVSPAVPVGTVGWMLSSLVNMAKDEKHRNSLNSSTTDVSTFKDSTTTKDMSLDGDQANIWRQVR